jgi:hypothetical protein
MVLRPKLDMYCKCSDKCKRPTICAEKVCAETVEADFITSFVGDFDEINAKTIKAETVTADQFIVNVPVGAPKPTVEIITASPPTATTAPDLALPVFGVPFGGFGATPGAIGDLPTVTGSNVIGTMAFPAPIAGGTVLKATYGGGGFPATSTLVVSFSLQDIDVAAEGYVLPALPQVVDSTNTFFSVLFPDPILSMTSTWSYAVTEITG